MSREHLGFGVFTTFVVKPYHVSSAAAANSRGKMRWGIFHLERHLLRLCSNASLLGLCGDTASEREAFFENATAKLLATLDVIPVQVGGVPLRCRLKVTSEGISIDSAPFSPPWSSETELAASFVVGERSIPEIKSLSCVLSQCARHQASAVGAQEAILVGYDGTVREGAWSNLFWFDRRGQLFTPENLILPGITRAHLVREFGATTRSISLPELLDEAQELVITQSTTGVSAVNCLVLNDQRVGRPTSMAAALKDQFERSQEFFIFPIDELRPSREWLVRQLVSMSSEEAANEFNRKSENNRSAKSHSGLV